MAKHEKRTESDGLRTVLQFILSFLLGLTLTACLLGLAALPSTSESYLKKQVDSEFLEQSLEAAREKLISLAIPSGLPENFFQDKLDTETFRSSLLSVIEQSYAQKSVVIDTDSLRQTLDGYFREYLAAQTGEDALEATEDGIAYLVDSCVETLTPFLNPLLIREITGIMGKVHTPVIIATVGCAALSILIAVFLLSISKTATQKLAYPRLSLLMSALLLIPIPAYLLATNEVKRIGILSKPLHTFVSQFIESLLIHCLIAGGAILLLFLILCFLDRKMKKRLDFTAPPVV